MDFMVKIKRGWMMGLISYEYILKHKKVLIFTIFSSLLTCISILTLLSLIIKAVKISPNLHQTLGHHHPLTVIHQQLPSSLFYAVGLIIIAQIINTFLHVALSHYVSNLFENKEASFLRSIGRALSRIITITIWFIINYSVGQILNSIRNQEGFIGKIIGNLIAGLASLGWNILTFFVLPIIALEDLGIIDSIKQSEKSMRQTFGQNIGATFALQTASFVLHSIATIIILLPAGIISYFMVPQPLDHIAPVELKFLIFVACVLLALPFIIVSPLTSAARTIFRVASYNYTKQKPTGPFSNDMIQKSFVSKTAQ